MREWWRTRWSRRVTPAGLRMPGILTSRRMGGRLCWNGCRTGRMWLWWSGRGTAQATASAPGSSKCKRRFPSGMTNQRANATASANMRIRELRSRIKALWRPWPMTPYAAGAIRRVSWFRGSSGLLRPFRRLGYLGGPLRRRGSRRLRLQLAPDGCERS